MGPFLVNGLDTWLPEITRSAGCELGAALAVRLVLKAIIGLLVAGAVADRIGTRRTTLTWFNGAVLFWALLGSKLPGIGVCVSVILAGCFVFSAQTLIFAYVGRVYPATARATARGRLGRGRPRRRDPRAS